MIIKTLKMKNFFRYYGEQRMDFVFDKEQNVTVIKGENGRGKTTILAAFSWCFYGLLEKPLSKDKMYNKNARSTLKENEIDKVFVEIIFIDKGTEYTIIREQTYKLHSEDIHLAGEEKVTITYKDKRNSNPKNVIDSRNFFNNIIPINLRQFFFFDGEKINRLAQEDGREEIKEAILNLLGLNVLENLKFDLETVGQKLNRDLKKYLNGKDAELSEEKDKCITEKQLNTKTLKELHKSKRAHEDEIEEIGKYLLSHNSEVVAALEKERNQLEIDCVSLKEDNKKIIKRINKLVSINAKNMLIFPYVKDIKNKLEEKRDKGELPSDIKETFIKDLIDRGTCICGSEICNGSVEYLKLEDLLKTAGKRELDDAYIRIISYINNNDLAEDNFFKEYNEMLSEEEIKENELQRKNNRIKEIDDQIKDIDIEEIQRKSEIRKKLQNKNIDIKIQIKLIETYLVTLEKRILEITKAMDKAQLDNLEAIKINTDINLVEELSLLNNRINETFKDEVRRDLDERIKVVFKSISHKEYRVPVLTEDLVLKVVNSFNIRLEEEILSTGESQVSSLSFIGALVSYSRDKQASPLYSSFMGGDFPIVMDSPFGNLDGLHSSHIAKGIGDLSNQVIIIVSEKQWGGDVAKNVYHRLGKMYELVEGDLTSENRGEFTSIREVTI